jgi:hypothetical protein
MRAQPMSNGPLTAMGRGQMPRSFAEGGRVERGYGPREDGTPKGDGHPVLLVPGFTASDATRVGLSAFLRSRGYHVETWGLGQNTGFKLKFSHALEQIIKNAGRP